MCGIAGILGSKMNNHEKINYMTKSLIHRGPDKLNIYHDESYGVYLGHTRLSILDLSISGDQPMISNSGRYVISYNGEIYNHIELRKNIKNYKWIGSSDTETILALVETYGIDQSLSKLKGMFAFCIYDKKYKKIFLARDRFGEKPLYYSNVNGSLIFGSELKVFKYCKEINFELDQSSISSFMKYGYIASPSSIYKNIKKLKQGDYITYDLSSKVLVVNKYWSIINKIQTSNENEYGEDLNLITNKIEKILENSVKNQMLSDVPLGCFLSGGIDSTLVTALMQKNEMKKINSFTIGFKENDYNEAQFASKVAQHLQTDHHELYLEDKDALNTIPHMSSTYDEPFADPSQIPTYLISKFASTKIKVALTGDGADEIFGGYNRYIWLNKISRYPHSIRKILSKIIFKFSPNKWNILFRNFHNFLPNKLRVALPGHKIHKLGHLLKYKTEKEIYHQMISFWSESDKLLNFYNEKDEFDEFDEFYINGDFEKSMMAYDSYKYLTDDILCKVDRAAMNFSLETRAPFLDHEMLETAWKIPLKYKLNPRTGDTKIILKKILEQYIPNKLISRPKMGFGIPLEHWLRGPLKNWMLDLLNQKSIKNSNIINFDYIEPFINEHLNETRNWQYHLWNLLMFQSWYYEKRIK